MAFSARRRDAPLAFALHLHPRVRGVQSIRAFSSIILISPNDNPRWKTRAKGPGEEGEGEAGWEYHRNSGFQRLNGGTAAARVNSIEV